jgi:hypothetical protein
MVEIVVLIHILVVSRDICCVICSIGDRANFLNILPFIDLFLSEMAPYIFASILATFPIVGPFVAKFVPTFVRAMSKLFAYIAPDLAKEITFVSAVVQLPAKLTDLLSDLWALALLSDAVE